MNKKIEKYIGCEFNENTKLQIENEFKSYTIEVCDLLVFYSEDYWEDQIRCVVTNGKIDKIKFN